MVLNRDATAWLFQKHLQETLASYCCQNKCCSKRQPLSGCPPFPMQHHQFLSQNSSGFAPCWNCNNWPKPRPAWSLVCQSPKLQAVWNRRIVETESNLSCPAKPESWLLGDKQELPTTGTGAKLFHQGWNSCFQSLVSSQSWSKVSLKRKTSPCLTFEQPGDEEEGEEANKINYHEVTASTLRFAQTFHFWGRNDLNTPKEHPQS